MPQLDITTYAVQVLALVFFGVLVYAVINGYSIKSVSANMKSRNKISNDR